MKSNAKSSITHNRKKITTSTWCQNVFIFIVYNWVFGLKYHLTCFLSVWARMQPSTDVMSTGLKRVVIEFLTAKNVNPTDMHRCHWNPHWDTEKLGVLRSRINGDPRHMRPALLTNSSSSRLFNTHRIYPTWHFMTSTSFRISRETTQASTSRRMNKSRKSWSLRSKRDKLNILVMIWKNSWLVGRNVHL